MLRIHLVSLFPEYFDSPLATALLAKGQERGLVAFERLNPRDRAHDKHRTVDDRPYGGGPGMVMMPGPLTETLREIERPGRMLLMSPGGRPFDQSLAFELAREENLTIICGRYEGIDARLEELFPLEPVSVGDFVLSGGESAAMCVVEAVTRLQPGFMGHEQAWEEESFTRGLLEYPHYTRPEVFEGLEVPEILRSGDHGKVAAWRREQSLLATWRRRPELLDKVRLSRNELRLLDGEHSRVGPGPRLGRNLFIVLVHHPVLNKQGRVQASSLTNLDTHDISRVSRSYGLGGFYATTPLEDQRLLAEELLAHWVGGQGGATNPDRAQALGMMRVLATLDEALADIEERAGMAPKVLLTSARGPESVAPSEVREWLLAGPVALVLGTASGLAPELTAKADGVYRPLRPLGGYNHLSVRAAAAIVVDRLLGDWD